mgnify:CR=1 FL=1
MFCTKCGKQNGDGQKFCQYCGAPLNGVRPPAPEKAKFRMRPVYWVLAAEIALAAAGIILGWNFCHDRFSAKRAAEEYAQAMEDGDWGKVYDSLLLEDGLGLSREDYIASQQALPEEEMDQVTVEELSPEQLDYLEAVNPERTGSDCVNLQMHCTVDGEEKDYLLTAVRTGKKLLFFDEWKILPYNMYQENVELLIPENTVLYINGKEVDTESLQASGRTGEEDSYESYLLPAVFYGGYQIQLASEGMETWSKLVQFQGDSTDFDFSDVSLNPDQETAEELLKLYGEAAQAYFSALMNGGSFDSLESYFTQETLKAGEEKEMFEDLQEDIGNAKKSSSLVSVEISDLKGESRPVSSVYAQEPLEAAMALSGNVTVVQKTSGGDLKELGGEREWPDDVGFRREDGVWKISSPQFGELIR